MEAAVLPPAPAEELAAILRQRAGMADEALARARLVESETGETLDKIVTRLGLISEDALAGALASALGLPLIDAADLPTENPAIADISAAFLRDRRALPLRRDGARVLVAMANPLDRDAVDGIAFATGCNVERCVARGGDIDAAIDRLYRSEAAAEVEDVAAAPVVTAASAEKTKAKKTEKQNKK